MTDSDEGLWASYSQLTTHRLCRQRWNYAHRRRLEHWDPNDPPVHRDFGSWWHALRAADSIERGRTLGTLKYAPETLSTIDDAMVLPGTTSPHDVVVAANMWWATRPSDVQDLWVDQLGEPLPERLTNLYARWIDEYADDRAHEEPLAVEVRWQRDLPPVTRPEGVRTGYGTLVGYVDELYRDRKRGLIVVRDHKSSKALAPTTAADDMMDSQLQLYAWGMGPLVTEWGLGPIRAVAYDRARSVAPQPPKLTQSGRLAVRDGQPSVNGTNLQTYLQWAAGPDGEGVYFPGAKKDGSAGGYYTAEPNIVEKLSSPAARSIWFQRTLVPLNVNLIKAHLVAAVDSMLDIHETVARVERTGAASRSLTSACRFCDFVKLCRDEMVGGTDGAYDLSDYLLRERPHNGVEGRRAEVVPVTR